MKPKLLFFTQSYITGFGGIASYAHDFVEAFSNKFQILVITADNYTKSERDNYVQDILYYNNRDFSVKNANDILNFIQKQKPSIIINSAFAILSLITPYISNDIKIFNISHFVNGLLSWYAGLNGNYTNGIIALSSYGKKYIDKKFNITDKKKTRVIFNFMPEIDSVSSDKFTRERLKIVYPGGCSFYKSAEIVCLALKKLLYKPIDFEFYWLGNTKIPGGNSGYFKTNNIRDCLPKDTRIKQIGPVNRETSKEILSNANIFLLPSRGEGFPITLVEAMRSGCIPIISTAQHGSLDIIKDKQNGIIIQQGNANAIVNTIEDIIKKHPKYKHIYKNSQLYYKEYLTKDVWCKKMEEIIDSPSNHYNRFSKLKTALYIRDVLVLRLLMFEYFVKDRFIQLYHFIHFRITRYLY